MRLEAEVPLLARNLFSQPLKDVDRVIAEWNREQQTRHREHGQQREQSSLLTTRPHLGKVLVHQVRDLQWILRELERHAASAAKDRCLFDLTADERGRFSHECSDGERVRPSLHDSLSALVVCERLLPVGQRLRILSILVRSHERSDLAHLFGHRDHAGTHAEVLLERSTNLTTLSLE